MAARSALRLSGRWASGPASRCSTPTPVLARIDARAGQPAHRGPARRRWRSPPTTSSAGTPTAITSGPLVDALRAQHRGAALLPAAPDADGVWCDAGPWESVPVTVARRLSPDSGDRRLGRRPKAGLHGRPAGGGPAARGRQAGSAANAQQLTARRYFSLLDPALGRSGRVEPPDLLIRAAARAGMNCASRSSARLGHRLPRSADALTTPAVALGYHGGPAHRCVPRGPDGG